ncbi:Peptidase MA superfamily protein [Clostridium cavendishii DSM 21758]|uniref:Peptidase MA superfamily protein n=1 Tax=Clostridium cavendishii DSM 21758 TaxID=1121302 RepID=A0A1M6DEZ9_9CLOT|nr:peptidase MA family metallohydrolase [Clostridium cavendishii]SHI71743.1 Peptidase MA superfamily protein [Clostridium cavendishii DSM 21758]
MIDKNNKSCLKESKREYELNFKKEIEHFIIYYTDSDKTCIEDVCNVLESSYDRITTHLKKKLDDKLIIEIHSDFNELHNALGFPNAPDWIRGGVGKSKIIIASPLNPPPGSNFDNVVNTAVHEFVHIIVNGLNGNTPRWLNEGIACYEAKDNNESWIIETVRGGLRSNIVPTFKDLDTGEDFEEFFKVNGYQYSYTIVEAIVEMFGYDKLCSLIKAPNDFVNSIGITENELQSQWIKYLEKNYV